MSSRQSLRMRLRVLSQVAERSREAKHMDESSIIPPAGRRTTNRSSLPRWRHRAQVDEHHVFGLEVGHILFACVNNHDDGQHINPLRAGRNMVTIARHFTASTLNRALNGRTRHAPVIERRHLFQLHEQRRQPVSVDCLQNQCIKIPARYRAMRHWEESLMKQEAVHFFLKQPLPLSLRLRQRLPYPNAIKVLKEDTQAVQRQHATPPFIQLRRHRVDEVRKILLDANIVGIGPSVSTLERRIPRVRSGTQTVCQAPDRRVPQDILQPCQLECAAPDHCDAFNCSACLLRDRGGHLEHRRHPRPVPGKLPHLTDAKINRVTCLQRLDYRLDRWLEQAFDLRPIISI